MSEPESAPASSSDEGPGGYQRKLPNSGPVSPMGIHKLYTKNTSAEYYTGQLKGALTQRELQENIRRNTVLPYIK